MNERASGRGPRETSTRHRKAWATRAAGALIAAAVIAGCAGAPESAKAPRWEPPAPLPERPAPSPSTPAVKPASSFAATSDRTIAGCTVFPRDHFLNAREVDTLPVHPRSDQYVHFLGGRDTSLKSPTSKVWNNARPGMPINIVDSDVIGKKDVVLNKGYTSRGFFGQYPIPKEPRVQGYPGVHWDRHLLMVDVADCTAYELTEYDPLIHTLTGLHTALSGTRYPLDDTAQAAMTTNVANTPMIGQYLMVDEVNSGKVNHPVAFCSSTTGKGLTWPARMSDGPYDRPDAPPMGTWIRLRGDVDRGRFTGQARAAVDAMREHGMVLTDTCGHRFSVLAENSDGWINDQIGQLSNLTIADFEAVDVTLMKQSDDSFRIN